MTSDEQQVQKQLGIAVDLLDTTNPKRPWSNLGDWSVATEYSAACRALACRIGRAANLSPGDELLEIACGHGASLSVWPDVFGVQTVDAMERQTIAIASILSDRPAALRHLWQMDANSIFMSATPWPMEEQYDAIVVVDAAYHFSALRSFLEQCGTRLRSGGRIAFTTLMLGSEWFSAPNWQRRLVIEFASRALIPAESLVAEDELTGSFRAAGFASPICEPLNREVLEGFVRFVERRRTDLDWRQRASAGWWKVEVTAVACRQLLRTGLVRYVMLNAVKR